MPRWGFSVVIFSLLLASYSVQATVDNNWQTKADNVCQQLQKANTAYQQQDLEQAHVNAVMAYFQNYDVYIEPAARVTFEQGHIFNIEQQFSNLNKMMVEHPTTQQLAAVNQQATTLCNNITHDALIMDQKNIKTPDYKVN